ncbi:MAG: DUF6591 domain-containing protein [Chitinophagales bacterium]
MNKKTTAFSMLIVAVVTLFLTSCNSPKKEFELTADNPSVKGGMKDLIEVTPGSYKLTLQEGDKGYSDGNKCDKYKLTVKLRSKQKTDKDFQEVSNSMMNPLSIQLLDNSGAPVVTASYNGSMDGLKKLLKDGEENFFEFDFCFTEAKLKDLSVAKFYMNTNATEYSSTSSESGSSDESSASSGSQDWDKLLKDYEEYTDQYIALMKKVKKNDASAISEYPGILEKAGELEDDLKKGESKLSSEQMSKMLKIQTKLASAAMEMTK